MASDVPVETRIRGDVPRHSVSVTAIVTREDGRVLVTRRDAARRNQRSLDISERIGSQAHMATTYSMLSMLEKDRGGPASTGIALLVKALAIRISLGVPPFAMELHSLAPHRSQLGPEQFVSLLRQSTSEPGLVEAITSLLAELDEAREIG